MLTPRETRGMEYFKRIKPDLIRGKAVWVYRNILTHIIQSGSLEGVGGGLGDGFAGAGRISAWIFT